MAQPNSDIGVVPSVEALLVHRGIGLVIVSSPDALRGYALRELDVLDEAA